MVLCLCRQHKQDLRIACIKDLFISCSITTGTNVIMGDTKTDLKITCIKDLYISYPLYHWYLNLIGNTKQDPRNTCIKDVFISCSITPGTLSSWVTSKQILRMPVYITYLYLIHFTTGTKVIMGDTKTDLKNACINDLFISCSITTGTLSLWVTTNKIQGIPV